MEAGGSVGIVGDELEAEACVVEEWRPSEAIATDVGICNYKEKHRNKQRRYLRSALLYIT